MSWRGDYLLETPQCLKQFIQELIGAELISEEQKLRMSSSKHLLTETNLISDPAMEMDLRHIEAKEISANDLALKKIPKHELLKEARRIAMQEEVQEQSLRRQNVAYNRELRVLEEALKKSHLDLGARQTKIDTHMQRSSSAYRRPAPSSDFSRFTKSRARRAKSTREIELQLAELEIEHSLSGAAADDEQPKSDSSHSSSENSCDSTVTILSKSDFENLKHFTLPPLDAPVKTRSQESKHRSNEPTMKLEKISINSEDKETLKKFWFIWRAIAFRQKNMRSLNKNSEEKFKQIDQFLRRFENNSPTPDEILFNIGSSSSSSPPNNNNKLQVSTSLSRGSSSKRTKSCTNLEQIIKEQKTKLREQEKMINKLKLEQIKVAAEKSQESTQEYLEEALLDSALPVRRKINYLRSSFPNILDKNYYEKPRPSFLVQMEKRQRERLERKNELRERTRLRILEQKKLQRENELAKKAEIAEQKRLDQELKLDQLRQESEMRANEQVAMAFCRLRRMRLAFGLFKQLLEQRRRRVLEAAINRELKTMKTFFTNWRLAVHLQVKEKIAQARKQHQINLLRFAWNQWRQMAMNAKRDRQVAEDFCDLISTEKHFIAWRKLTRTSYEEFLEKGFDADHHYDRKVLEKCWIAWRKLHNVLAEEKQVELKKEKLRNAIRTVLPDFRPTFVESVKNDNQL